VAQTPEEVAARQAIEAQLLARDDRILSAQRTTVDSAKLVSTFVLALAGTFLGTALQVSPRGSWELVGLVLIGASLLCALLVILLDSLDTPTFDDVPGTSDDAHRQQMMQVVVNETIKSNGRTAGIIRMFALLSVGLSSLAGVVSGISLMLK
jgi:hypothetical protein